MQAAHHVCERCASGAGLDVRDAMLNVGFLYSRGMDWVVIRFF